MSGAVKVNIRGFDFDSREPVQAQDVKPAFIDTFGEPLIHNALAWVVVLIGAKAIEWFILGGGTGWLISMFLRFAPGIYNMAAHGIV